MDSVFVQLQLPYDVNDFGRREKKGPSAAGLEDTLRDRVAHRDLLKLALQVLLPKRHFTIACVGVSCERQPFVPRPRRAGED